MIFSLGLLLVGGLLIYGRKAKKAAQKKQGEQVAKVFKTESPPLISPIKEEIKKYYSCRYGPAFIDAEPVYRGIGNLGVRSDISCTLTTRCADGTILQRSVNYHRSPDM